MPGDAADMTAPQGTPAAEVAIDADRVRALLREQHPDLAPLRLEAVDSGWDNAIFRLGGTMAVRLPRRALAAQLIVHEQDWLPALAPRLPLPVPAPLRKGAPGAGYPWRWSIVPWIEGIAADLAPPAAAQAPVLGHFLARLHVPAPPEAPRSALRGVPLAQRADAAAERMARLERKTSAITAEVRTLWDAALAAPMDVEPTWIHGDLHARNVLVADGAIRGIVDWGDMAAGDRATDLAALWMLFESPRDREAARSAWGSVSEPTWARSKGWAILFGAMLLDSGLADHPRHAAMGAATLRRVAAG